MPRVRGVSLLLLSISLVASCATPPPTVELAMTVERDGDRVHINGNTDLPDDAILAFEVRHEDYEIDPETPIDMLFTEGLTTVSNGEFQIEVNISSFEPGEIQIWLAFQMKFINSNRAQPRQVIRQFGNRGELLRGENVTNHGEDGKRVELSQTLHW